MRTLSIKFEGITGSDITEICYDICEMANKLGCMTEVNVNGVSLVACPNDNHLELISAYMNAKKQKIDIAFTSNR